MSTRTRRHWRPDNRGHYTRQLGWERSRRGKLQQHKFALGTDRKEAERRERKLVELWETFAARRDEPRPLWPDNLLVIAKWIAKGIPDVPVPRGRHEKQVSYAERLERMQAKYPMVLFVPEDRHAFEIGQAALEVLEAVPKPELTLVERPQEEREVRDAARLCFTEAGLAVPPELGGNPLPAKSPGERLFGVMRPEEAADLPVRRERPQRPRDVVDDFEIPADFEIPKLSVPVREKPAGTLHAALSAYQTFLEREYHSNETGQVTPWGRTQVRQVTTLKRHHTDQLLAELDGEGVEELIGYWRRRPLKAGTSEPMTPKSAGNYMGMLTRS